MPKGGVLSQVCCTLCSAHVEVRNHTLWMGFSAEAKTLSPMEGLTQPYAWAAQALRWQCQHCRRSISAFSMLLPLLGCILVPSSYLPCTACQSYEKWPFGMKRVICRHSSSLQGQGSPLHVPAYQREGSPAQAALAKSRDPKQMSWKQVWA